MTTPGTRPQRTREASGVACVASWPRATVHRAIFHIHTVLHPQSSGRSRAGASPRPKSTAIHASVPASSAPTNHAVDGAADAIASDRAREQRARSDGFQELKVDRNLLRTSNNFA